MENANGFQATTPATHVEIRNAKPIEKMTDREIAEETLYWIRTVGQALAQFQNMGPAGIMKMMMGR